MAGMSRAIVFTALCVFGLYGQTPTIEQSLSMKQLSGAEISPDGRFVAHVIQQANWDENAFVAQIWMADLQANERYQLTSGNKSNRDPRWSPDSKRLAFVSERAGKAQVFVIAPRGGEAVQLTAEENGVGAFRWSPDGTSIAYLSSGPESKAKKDRRDKYGDFEIFEGDYTMQHLWRVVVPAEISADPKQRPKPEALTSGKDFNVEDFSWSPDGKYIAFSATRDPALSSGGTSDIYLLSLGDKLVKKLVSTPGPERDPVWSPDGRQIAFATSDAKEFYFYSNTRVATVPLEGGTPRVISKDFDEDPNLLVWSENGIYFTGRQKTEAHLFRLDPDKMTIERVSGPSPYQVGNVTFTKDFQQIAFTASLPNHFPELYVTPAARFDPKQVTDMAADWKSFRLGSREVVQWKSTDGTLIEGVLIKPPDYDPKRKYPLLVVIHGGPTGIDTPALAADRTYPIERFLAKGALVLRPNYRGSAGYGEKFRSLNVRNLGLGDYQDVISGVDSLIAKGLIDKDRVGAMGWSQGGYISAFITTYSDRFKAVSVGAGISDWTTYYVNTDIFPFTRQYLKATPWDDAEIYRKTSPISYVKNAKTPTLIQHGDQDKRVPPPNAFELYRALRDRGVPCKLILYKGFGHPIDKPKQQRAVMEHNYEWFSRYIWGEEAQPETVPTN
jgi:dipeptidyl aminopeptidase/acylaminoacyl peptidase